MSTEIAPIAARIINLFGGGTAVAAVIGCHPSAVTRWKNSKARNGTGGLIPAWHQRALLDYARAHGIPLSPDDFFDAPPAAPAAEQGSADAHCP